MADPIRNPQPLVNQELDAEREHRDADLLTTNQDPGILASEAAAGRSAQESRGKVVEWRQATSEKAEQVKERASEVLDQAKERVSDVYARTEAGVKDALEQGKQRASEALQQGREKAAAAAQRARVRARFYADEYPLQVIAVAAGVGLLVGVFLRIWRSSRYERD